MQQDFLSPSQLLRQLDCSELKTVQGNPLQILHPGHHLQMTLSDFCSLQMFGRVLQCSGFIAVYSKSTHVKKIIKFVTDLWD